MRYLYIDINIVALLTIEKGGAMSDGPGNLHISMRVLYNHLIKFIIQYYLQLK